MQLCKRSGLRGGCAEGVLEPPGFVLSPFLAYSGRICQPNTPLFPAECADWSPHLTDSRLTREPGARCVLIACFPLQILTIGHTRTGNCLCTREYIVNPACMVPSHSDFILCIAFSPDGTRVVSGSEDKTVRIWDARTGAQVSSHPPPSRLRTPFPAPSRFGVRGQFHSMVREKTPAFSFYFSAEKPVETPALSFLTLYKLIPQNALHAMAHFPIAPSASTPAKPLP